VVDTRSWGRDPRDRPAHPNRTDRSRWDPRNLDTNLCLSAASILDSDVAIAIYKAAPPFRDHTRANLRVEETSEERGGAISDPTLPHAIKIKAETCRSVEKPSAEVCVIVVSPVFKFETPVTTECLPSCRSASFCRDAFIKHCNVY
jgi:hypothetical protein